MKCGYARVSTNGQDLQAQVNALEREGCEKIYSEKFIGTKAKSSKISGDIVDT